MISDYLPLLFVFALAAGFAGLLLGLTHIVGPRIRDMVKQSVYESGVDPLEEAHTHISVKYFIVALVFIIFDIEIVFMYPWAVVFKDFLTENAFILFEMLFFMAVLIFGYIYIWRKGVFEWK